MAKAQSNLVTTLQGKLVHSSMLLIGHLAVYAPCTCVAWVCMRLCMDIHAPVSTLPLKECCRRYVGTIISASRTL